MCGSGAGRREGCFHYHAWPKSYDHRPSHPYNAGTEHVASTRRIESDVRRVEVPLGYAYELYALRLHVDLVKGQVGKLLL